MRVHSAFLILSLAAAPAAAGETSDFVTPEAGNAVSQNIAVQAEAMWPAGSANRQIDVPADYAIRKLIRSDENGEKVTSVPSAGTGGGSSSTSGQ